MRERLFPPCGYVVFCSIYFFVINLSILFLFTLKWITGKELERVIETKGDEFRRKKNMEIQSGGEKMRNASGQQGENERQ